MEFEEVDIQAIRFFCARGGLLTSTVNPSVTCKLPEGAVTIGEKSFCRVSIQTINIDESLVLKHMGKDAAVSPVVILEPIRRKFHKPLTKCIPIPGVKHKKFSKKNIRVLFSITGSGENTEWQEITSAIDPLIISHAVENGFISVDHVVTGRFAVVCCDNSIMDVPATMSEMLKSCWNGGIFGACNNLPNLDLLKAARCGDKPALLACLQTEGVEVNYQNKGGQTALHIACKEGHTDIVRELLARMADPSIFTKKGNLPLHLACFYGHLAVVKVLVEAGCDVNSLAKDGYPALYPALLEMHADIVKYLLHKGADITWTSQDGLSLPLVAVYSTYDKEKIKAMLQLLLHEVNLTQFYLNSQLINRGFRCHGEALLFSVTARHAAREMIGPVRQQLSNLSTELLQEDLSSIETCKGELGKFLQAVKEGNLKEVSAILSQHKDIINISTERDISGLHCACLHGYLPIVKCLIESGANVNYQSQGEFSSLYLASQNGHTEVVRLLLRSGADSQAVNKYGLTALDIASELCRIEVTAVIAEFKTRDLIKGEEKVTIDNNNLVVEDEDIREDKDLKKGCCTM